MTSQNIKSYLKSINPRSPIFIVGVFSVVLLLLIALTVRSRVADQEQLNTIAQATPTPKDTFVPKSEIVPGQINVKFKDGLTDLQTSNSLLKYNARIKSTITGINVKVVTVPLGQEDSVRAGLIKDGVVKYAEPDHVAHGTFSPNDTDFGNQYGLNNTGQTIKGNSGKANADIHIQEAWDVTKGKGMTVAVLDTGLDLSHPEFTGGKVGLQKVFVTNSIDDGFGHGTHTAGIVSANTNNTTGIAGTCPDCGLMIGKVLDDSGNGPYSVIEQGITLPKDNGSKVISMSLGR